MVCACAPLPFQGANDVFVIGAVRSGHRPDMHRRAPQLPPDTPSGLRELLTACWAADPRQRPLTAIDVLERLLQAAPTELPLVHTLLPQRPLEPAFKSAPSLPFVMYANLHDAVCAGDAAVLHRIIAAGADVDELHTVGGKTSVTALHTAAVRGHEDAVRTLVALGARVDVTDTYERTPLHHAARDGHDSVTHALLTMGARVDAVDKDEWTPLHFAAAEGHESIARALVALGARVDAVDKDGWTPLHRAVADIREGVLRALVELGARVDAFDAEGRTPLHYAAFKATMMSSARSYP